MDITKNRVQWSGCGCGLIWGTIFTLPRKEWYEINIILYSQYPDGDSNPEPPEYKENDTHSKAKIGLLF
jgi:hypothetical protein